MKIPVTVVILTYNRLEYLKHSLMSIQGQSYEPSEIIVLDNCSTDGTDQYFKNHKAVVFVRNEQNLGVDVSFRKAFDLANNPFVLIFHDDDVMAENMLENLFKKISSVSSLVFVASYINFTQNPRTRFVAEEKEWIYLENKLDFLSLLWTGAPVGFSTVMFRKSMIKTEYVNNFFFGKYFDRPFLIELMNAGKAAVSKSKLVDYRIHEGQDSQITTSSQYLYNLQSFYIKSFLDLGLPLCFFLYFEERVKDLSCSEKNLLRSHFKIHQKILIYVLRFVLSGFNHFKKKYSKFRTVFKIETHA